MYHNMIWFSLVEISKNSVFIVDEIIQDKWHFVIATLFIIYKHDNVTFGFWVTIINFFIFFLNKTHTPQLLNIS